MLSQCPSCKHQVELPESVLGKKVRCSGCQAVFVAEAKSAPPEPEPEPLDMLEVLPDAPAKPAKKKTAPPKKEPPTKPKKAQSQSDFDFNSDKPGTSPQSEFSFVNTKKKVNLGVRLRASAAAAFMRYGVIYALFPTLGQMALPIAVGIMERYYPAMGLSCCPLLMYFVFAIVIFLGAGNLERMNSFGMAITGAVFSILMGLVPLPFVLLLMLGLGLAVWQLTITPMQIVGVALMLFTFFQAVFSIWGGIRAILVLFNADVRAEMAGQND